jgi:putative ABC transport system ATP-binding protein
MSTSKAFVTVAIEDGSSGIAIVDAMLRPVANGFGQVHVGLPAGVYKARSRVGAESVEQLFVVEPTLEPVTVQLAQVPFSSPVPLTNTRTSHEYQEQGVQSVVSGPTVQAGSGAEFLLFVRDPGMQPNDPPPVNRETYARTLRPFTLRRASDGETVVDLESQGTTNVDSGYAAIRAAVAPGAYVLTAQPAGDPPRHQAIYAVPNHRTEVFISCNRVSLDGVPRLQPALDDLAISMPPVTSSFDPSDATLRKLEVARQALVRGRRVFEPDALKEFVWLGDQNPMLTLFAAHLIRLEPDAAVRERLYPDALAQLGRVYGDIVPDLTTLKAAMRGPDSRVAAIETPPMLWQSWTLAVRPKSGGGDVIAKRSLTQAVANQVLPSGPWLAWSGDVWNADMLTEPWSAQSSRLSRAMTSFVAQGWIAKTMVDAATMWSYLNVESGEPNLEHLSKTLIDVPWENLVGVLHSSDLTNMQRALLPTLIAVRAGMADAEHPLDQPEKIVAMALGQFITTPSAVAEAVVGLMENAATHRRTPTTVSSEAADGPTHESDRERVVVSPVSVAGSTPLISLRGVSKVFYTDDVETHALSRIDLEIKRGEYIAIAGPSGCGKSTLLSILGLLDTPTEGGYVLNNRSVAELPHAERARVRNREIGFIFQSFNLIGDLTVYENVELPLTYRGIKSTERKERVLAALEEVSMAHRAKHLPSQLSGGQQQRVAVARAVAGSPSILLADEPTGNLDSRNGEMIMELLRQLHSEGATVCMVTHDPRYARHAERSVHLFDGRIVEGIRDRAAQRTFDPQQDY